MTQTTINRRRALAVVAAVPAAAAIGSSAALSFDRNDRLLALIRQYEAEVAIIDATDDPSQRQINSWQRKARAILEEAASLPCLTAASAVAVLNLILKDEMLESSSIFSDQFTVLVAAVKDYLEGRHA